MVHGAVKDWADFVQVSHILTDLCAKVCGIRKPKNGFLKGFANVNLEETLPKYAFVA